MADISITAANVKILTDAGEIQRVKVSEAVTQGQVAYRDTSDGRYGLCRAGQGGTLTAKAEGIYLTPAAGADDWAIIAKQGCKVDLGATLTEGTDYHVSSANAGGIIAGVTDLTTGDAHMRLGEAEAAGIFVIDLSYNPNVTEP